ncbi:MAG: hypothetical protein CFE26_14920 [Verrucomicrobiales bacterium VVV1]|nr:MAG: hypothetical protein CFE26_14920 [Verrucomicrobiales bacterium VVV1]
MGEGSGNGEGLKDAWESNFSTQGASNADLHSWVQAIPFERGCSESSWFQIEKVQCSPCS